jgi:DNA polymerase I-like protein with 3'-5' exonuclease and polymerase domains
MLLTVHDSVLLEAPLNLLEETQQIAVEVMESPIAGLRVPLKAKAATGKTWADCK